MNRCFKGTGHTYDWVVGQVNNSSKSLKANLNSVTRFLSFALAILVPDDVQSYNLPSYQSFLLRTLFWFFVNHLNETFRHFIDSWTSLANPEQSSSSSFWLIKEWKVGDHTMNRWQVLLSSKAVWRCFIKWNENLSLRFNLPQSASGYFHATL